MYKFNQILRMPYVLQKNEPCQCPNQLHNKENLHQYYLKKVEISSYFEQASKKLTCSSLCRKRIVTSTKALKWLPIPQQTHVVNEDHVWHKYKHRTQMIKQ